jgi:hypothetical protein
MTLPTQLLLAIAGASAGLGSALLVLAVAGDVRSDRTTVAATHLRHAQSAARQFVPDDRAARLTAVAALIGGGMASVTVGVPVVALLTVGAVLLAVNSSAETPVAVLNARGAAVAAWCETVRHELEAGQPERAALLAACDHPAPGLESPLRRLAARLESESVPDALWSFAVDARHPAVGNAVAALDVAYRFGAGDLPALMAGQVESTRNQVQAHRELHAARAKHRRAMVLLLGLFTAVVTGLFVIWPDFLAAYRGVQGQLVLGGIGVAVLGAVRALIRLGRPEPVPDFFTVHQAGACGSGSDGASAEDAS